MTTKKTSQNAAVVLRKETFNRFAETSNIVLGSQYGARGGTLGTTPPVSVPVHNKTGRDYNSWEPLPLENLKSLTPSDQGPDQLDDYYQRFTLESKASALAITDYGRWGLTIEPIKNGEYGRVAIAGVVVAKVYVVNVNDLFADVFNTTDSPAALTSATTGSARILNKPDATGLGFYLLQLGQLGGGTLIGTLDGDLAHDGTQTINTSKATVSGSWMGAAKELVSGTKVEAVWYDAEWLVVGANACESDE